MERWELLWLGDTRAPTVWVVASAGRVDEK